MLCIFPASGRPFVRNGCIVSFPLRKQSGKTFYVLNGLENTRSGWCLNLHAIFSNIGMIKLKVSPTWKAIIKTVRELRPALLKTTRLEHFAAQPIFFNPICTPSLTSPTFAKFTKAGFLVFSDIYKTVTNPNGSLIIHRITDAECIARIRAAGFTHALFPDRIIITQFRRTIAALPPSFARLFEPFCSLWNRNAAPPPCL